MLKKIAALLGLLGVLVVGYLIFGPPIVVSVPEEKVQEEVAKRLPMEVKKAGVTMNIDDLLIDFLEGDLVHVNVGMDLSGYGMIGRAEGEAKSSLRYEAGDFYLEDITLDDLQIVASDESAATVEDLSQAATGLWNRFRGEDLDTAEAMDSLKEKAFAKIIPKAQEMANQKLQEIPVYSLNDQSFSMDMAALALEDVTFSADSAEVTLDPGNVILWVLGMVLMGGAVLLFAVGMALGGGRGLGGLV